MAVVTVTAGVKIPSASSAAPPIIAGKTSHFPHFFTRLNRAKMPPSLWLSACMAISTYLTVVSRIMVHMTRESAPYMTFSPIPAIPPFPAIMDFITYMGEVPISQ